jgi:hypothetical protein
MEHEVDFENWLMSFDISLSKHNQKIIVWAVEIIISKFLSYTPRKAVELMCNI